MDKKEIIAGLDIGTTKIACIVGTKNQYGKLEVLGFGKAESLGVKRGVVANIDHTVQSIVDAVKQAIENSGRDVKLVNVGIAGQHIKSIQYKGSTIRSNTDKEITREEVDNLKQKIFNLAMSPGEEIIDVIPQDYIIDKESGIKEPVGMLGSSLEANFHIIIGLTTAAKNIYKCVRKAGLEVSEMTLEPLASAEAVLSEEEKEAGVALVDIGGGTTDIAIFHDNILVHTAVIPFGGEVITDDIKEGCTIIKKHAEDLKVKFGSALATENSENEIVAIPGLRGRPAKEISLKNLSSIIQARMEEIIERVYYEIKSSGFEKKLIAGIVLTGGGAQMKHIAQLTSFITGMETRIGYPNEHLADNVNDELAKPMYSTGVGLVIIGYDHANIDTGTECELPEITENEIEVNPEENKKPKKEKQSRKVMGKTEKIGKNFFSKLKNFFDNEEIE